MNISGDTFSNSEDCQQQYQNAHTVHIIADGKIVGYIWGPHEPVFGFNYTYRIGGMNCSASSKEDAINKLLTVLNNKR